MALTPDDWSVVVIGHWNRAIFSPSGIARRLFQLPEGTPVQVLVPLDVVAPYHIRHDDIIVIPNSDRLIIKPANATIPNLFDALKITVRALEDLPRTPVFAAGLNLRYRSEDSIPAIQSICESAWDERIGDNQLEISTRTVVRIIRWNDGQITASATTEQNGACSVLLNFDFHSTENDKLIKWLSFSEADISSKRDLILYKTMGLAPEDFNDG